uniref:Endonuclease/exonuclease/phosphatase domain-containing protein n=1 Tax=Paramormyrops kingsleyae TaxID=1676925 RepID=A0A3B3TC35_9TELE
RALTVSPRALHHSELSPDWFHQFLSVHQPLVPFFPLCLFKLQLPSSPRSDLEPLACVSLPVLVLALCVCTWQKDMTLEDEPFRLEGVQYATGEEQRTSTSSARKNDATGPKPKGRSAVDVSEGERKVRCCNDFYFIGIWNMTRLNIDILGISKLKWTGEESLRRNGVAFIVNKRVGKDEVDQFLGSQKITGITGKFGFGVQNEAGHRLVEFCQENTMVIENTLFQQPKRRRYTWTTPDGQHRNQIDFVLCSQRWRSSIQSVKTRPGADCGSDHELLIATFRLKLKKVGRSIRQFRYELNHIPDGYTVEVANRFKELDLTDRVPEELWMEVRNIAQEVATKTIPKKMKYKKAKWMSEEALQIAEERREVKGMGERERYTQLNAEFQRIARRKKNAFFK